MKLNRTTIIVILISVAVGTVFGYFISGDDHQHNGDSASENSTTTEEQVWTCSMHPSVRQNEAGDCPICGMDLIPVSESSGNNALSEEAISMSATAMKLANIKTIKVNSSPIEKDIRVSGKVQENEQERYVQSAHFPGRIEDLNVNYKGEFVRKGQLIAVIYSPELLTAQEELLQAYKVRKTQPGYFDATKEKLRNWKLSDKQIEDILNQGKAKEEFNLRADYSGYVSKVNVNEGDYLKQGQQIFRLDNLSSVWIYFDVYEQDLPFVKKGSKVSFDTKAYPNEEFTGEITYIDPRIDPKSRVAKARMIVQNSTSKLKPEMLVSGDIQYTDDNPSIIIPKSAVMWTGKRSVIYIKEQNEQGTSFVMREVELGLPLNDAYVIEKGLEIGEEIAVEGTFSIDAAAQLAGKTSMMSADETKSVEISQQAKDELSPLFNSYFELKDALTQDDFNTAQFKTKELKKVFSEIDMKVFKGESHEVWMDYQMKMKHVLEHIQHHDDIEGLRKNFIALSDWMIQVIEHFQPVNETIYLQHCPMADNDNGASWLSKEEPVVNPYFGSSMLGCGEVKKTFE